MKRRIVTTALVAITSLLPVLGIQSPSQADSGMKWAQSTLYGYQSEDLVGPAGSTKISDIITYFIPPTNDFFSGESWRFHITRYLGCDPRGKTKSECPATGIGPWNSNVRTGNPPGAGTACVSLNIDPVGVSDCKSYGMAQASYQHGNFPGLDLSKAFTNNTWLCTEIQTKRGSGAWTPNKNDGYGLRACAQLHV